MTTRTLRPLILLGTSILVVAMATACGGQAAPAAPTAAPAKPAATTAPAAPAATAAPAAPAATKPAAAAPAASFAKMDVKLAHVGTTEMNYHKASVRLSEIVKEKTGGAVNIQVFPNSQLGSEKDNFEQVKNGIIQMTNGSSGMLANFPGWEPLGVLAMPYIMKGNNEDEQYVTFKKLVRGPIFKEISDKAVQQSGIRALDLAWFYGQRHLSTSKKQVNKVDDLKGLKIRTPDAPLQKLAMTYLGASVTPMAVAEVYSALQMGVVDGQENPINTIYSMKFYEVQKFVALTGHMSQGNLLVTNDKWYQSLSPELRKIIDEASLEAGDFMSAGQMKDNKQNLEDLKAKGMTVNTVNVSEFAEATKDAWKEFEPQFGKDLYEKVRAAQN